MKQVLTFIIILFICGCGKDPEAKTVHKIDFKNVLILGNSITYAPANQSIGWNTSCGMAASAPEKDYVHLLTAKFKQSNAAANVQAVNIAEFEQNYATYDFDAKLKTYRDSKPDLLILRIGENVDFNFDAELFTRRYQALITYMKVDNPDLKILAVGSFWGNKAYINSIMSKYTPYVSLENLGKDLGNYAFDMQNVSDGVKQHPGDKGMQQIAATIWEKLASTEL